MKIVLDWDISHEDWDNHSKTIRRFPLLQSLDYGLTTQRFYGHTLSCAALRRNHKVIGLCAVKETGALNNWLHAIMCDRGPMWLDGQENAENFELFVQALAKKFPRRIGRRRRFIPEYKNADDILKRNKWHTIGDGYDTAWMDLTHNEKTLRKNLKKNWRGSLQKFEKSDVDVVWDETGKTLPWLLKHYEIDKAQRGYEGASPKFLRWLGNICASKNNLLIGQAIDEGHCIGSIMILCHGLSATYQVGWTSDDGRKKCVHHGLLWQAMLKLKSRAIKDLDLGGMNDEKAKGVQKFKKGLGGESVTLAGIYG